MVGRDEEKQKAKTALDKYRLCLIAGGPGEGKSLLAHTVARELRLERKYPDGAYPIDMRGET